MAKPTANTEVGRHFSIFSGSKAIKLAKTGNVELLDMRDVNQMSAARGLTADWTPAGLAAHTQAVLQGAFILAKATGDRAVARDSVDHLKRYIEMLFAPDRKTEK